ncbi:MAG: hypothetical protein CSB55_08035 [Candidatus Cloacimonadota bacterium]|nr:MAG: hypothetical protein CSB55_08035 [Candidatus Cloacimonadota bacterium]
MKIENIIKEGIKSIDLTNEKHAELIIDTANNLLEIYPTFSELQKLEEEWLKRDDEKMTFLRSALKLATSKSLISCVKKKLHISIVFAVYKEHLRIRKSSEHPYGEDFLRKKAEQAKWLFGDQKLITWSITVVDDGCPERSGKTALEIVETDSLGDKVKVLFLEDAIKQGLPPVKCLNSSAESQKGSSILYGMWDAVQERGSENHIVLFTDADLSTHLGQIMLLVDPIINHDCLAAIGSRREKKSVVVKKSSRNNRGKLFIFLWKRMISNLGNIVDTQCGFKAFRADIVSEIISDNIEHKFAFDVELLIKTALLKPDSIAKVPIAWIDSDIASTTADLQPYLPMLKSIANMHVKYFSNDCRHNDFVDFVNSLDKNSFNRLLENIPSGITDREPDSFTDYAGVSVSELKNAVKI